MHGDRLQEQRTAAATIGKQPPPEISTLPRPADGPPGATQWREIQEHDGIRGLKPDIDHILGPEIPVHDPRLLAGKLALDSCPLVAGRRGQPRTPEQLVELDHWQAGDFTQADR
jgi:hypothetical protein